MSVIFEPSMVAVLGHVNKREGGLHQAPGETLGLFFCLTLIPDYHNAAPSYSKPLKGAGVYQATLPVNR